MRHLNKIVFINSANIPYAEVMLDGNVHFGGTQGVGKSTVLRAILFFYTADKMRLGIQQGQRSFEEFYFPKSNSYIIYEVKTDYGAYSILLSRSQGKAAFRFIDAPYQKNWFIDTDRRVESDWIRIRERIGTQTDTSVKIDTYELYRSIIFGNAYDPGHKYDKYAIVKSSKYQNIPRSIQNVFLNSKLDADFVKNTIIQSMIEDEDPVNLAVYRRQIADFEREFKEINCWFQKDNDGNIVVRIKADKVIKAYRLLIACEQEIIQTWHRLNFTVANSREQLPHIENDMSVLKSDIKKIDDKLNNIQQEYNKEHDSLKQRLGEVNARLDDIRKQRKYYDSINITSILELNARQPELQSEKEQKESLLRSLEEQCNDIAEKYRRVREILDNELNAVEFAQAKALQNLREELQAKRDLFSARRDKQKTEIEAAYSEWLSASDDRLNSLHDEFNRSDKQLSELKHWHPKEKEINSVKEEIDQLKLLEHKCSGELTVVTNEIESLRREAEMKVEKIENDSALKQEVLQNEIKKLTAALEETQKILSRWDGSLYQWLAKNKPDWENNIGKVIDEQNVLYANGLAPSLSDNNGFFGITIDLTAIETHHRTPDQYRALEKDQKNSLNNKNNELRAFQIKSEGEIAAINKAYKNKISEKQQLEVNLKVRAAQIPLKLEDTDTRLRLLQQEEDALIKAESEKRTHQYNEANLKLDRENETRRQRSIRRSKDLKQAENEYTSSLKEIKREDERFVQQQKADKAAKMRDIDERHKIIDQQERDELKGKGADVKAIELCRKDISDINKQLDIIEKQKRYVYEYQKDDKELFSRESEFRTEKQHLTSKDETIRQTFENKRRRYQNEIAEKQTELNAKEKFSQAINSGLEQYEQLFSIENIIPESLIQDDAIEKNDLSCSELVSQMRGVVNAKRIKQDNLKVAVNSFHTHFGPDNTFSFITPQCDEDFRAFAVNLMEFVDNNKIEIYRERVSDHYSNILGSIAREVGMLEEHAADVKRIINDVNRDFRERNFAGVIRNIELRADESSDRMMQLLNSIHRFIGEEGLSIGEMNLFSNDTRDKANLKVIDYLKKFMTQLQKEPSRSELTLSDTFTLKFRIQENDNDTGWVERINNVGSDGTDILVKAMVNIMLINVFKAKASHKKGDFIIHCMMDEIGKLHPSNVAGILQFANVRNIYLINSSPMSYNADIYKYNYLLTKDSKSQTHIKRLLTVNM